MPQLTCCIARRSTKKAKSSGDLVDQLNAKNEAAAANVNPEGRCKYLPPPLQLSVAHTDGCSASEAETLIEQEGKEEAA